MIDYVQIFLRKYPDSKWTLDGANYSGLVWLSEDTKPTEAELEALWPTVQAEVTAEAQAAVDAKASAIAKLQELGLTVEEVKAAFGLEAE